jgi:lysyl-tRNA synthetase class I
MDKLKDRDGSAPRSVLKLKTPSTRLRPPEPSVPQPRDAGSWSDVYKRKMQADMDALGFGVEPTAQKGPRR